MAGGTLAVANFQFITSGLREEVKRVVIEWVNETAQISHDNFAPEKTGLMKSTYKVEIIEDNQEVFKIQISVGGNGQAPYVVYVHEIPYKHFNPPSAQYKFLSTPFNMRIPQLQFMLSQIQLAEVFV